MNTNMSTSKQNIINIEEDKTLTAQNNFTDITRHYFTYLKIIIDIGKIHNNFLPDLSTKLKDIVYFL